MVPSGMASLKVINNGSFSICELYVVKAESSDWGDNQLDSGQTIDSGSNYTVSNVPDGNYNLKAVACDDQGEAERLDEVLDGPMEWTLTD